MLRLPGMNQQSFQNNWSSTSLIGIALEILAVVALLSLRLLLKLNMAWNEVDVLPSAKQYANPTWIPRDWLLNLPSDHRMLFEAVFGRLIASWGFLASSIAGRLLCYCLVASGLVLIGRKLGLNLLLLLLAVSLFLAPNDYRSLAAQAWFLEGNNVKWVADALMLLSIGLMLLGKRLGLGLPLPLLLLAVSLFLRGNNGQGLPQGLAAGEWLVGGFEAKAVAYGLILLAIGLMLRRCYRLMALLLGLATSFHVLVGGYTFLTVLGWLVLRRKTRLQSLRELGWIVAIYLAASAFAIKLLLEQLFLPTSTGPLLPSYIYVFLRNPHHLNPLSWASDWWVNLMAYLLILLSSVGVIWRNRPFGKLSEQYVARMGLFEFTLISLIPFILGLAIAPFDSQGRLLQYYPFRLGDVMLPLNTCLLFACALKQTFARKARWALLLVCILLLNCIVRPQFVIFQDSVQAIRQFPSEQQEVDPEWKNLCDWVRNNTPKDAIFVSPPVEFVNFTWLAERPTIAKFKLVPNTKAAILPWYERLCDLSGSFRWLDVLKNFGKQLSDGYNRLTTSQAEALMVKYQADYLVTRIQHQLNLPVAYSNQFYILYKKSG